MKQVRGSFTVEAAFIVPMIVLITAGIIYMLFYEHDRTVLGCYAVWKSEILLYSEETENSPPLLMMDEISEEEASDGNTVAGAVINLLESTEKASVAAQGRLTVGIRGAAAYTGEAFTAKVKGRSVRVSYTDDCLKKQLENRE